MRKRAGAHSRSRCSGIFLTKRFEFPGRRSSKRKVAGGDGRLNARRLSQIFSGGRCVTKTRSDVVGVEASTRTAEYRTRCAAVFCCTRKAESERTRKKLKLQVGFALILISECKLPRLGQYFRHLDSTTYPRYLVASTALESPHTHHKWLAYPSITFPASIFWSRVVIILSFTYYPDSSDKIFG